jgi:hypothetical protein
MKNTMLRVLGMAVVMLAIMTCYLTADEGSNAVCKTIVIAGKDIAGKYDISWAAGEMDLTEVDLSKGTVKIEFTSSFAGSKVYIDPETPIIIKASESLGDVRFPSGNGATWGKGEDGLIYRSKNYNEAKAHIELTISVSFGDVAVVSKG